MTSEGNVMKNDKPAIGLSFMTMLQHTGRFWSRISQQHCSIPTNTPDLAAADLHLFPCLNSALKGQRLCEATGIIRNATEELKRLPQNGFQECYRRLYSRSQKCAAAQGDYFEGNVT
jgi:hypothetical protein